MNIRLESSDGVAFLKIKRNDGKWAKVEMPYEAVRILHEDIISSFPEFAVPEGIKKDVERLSKTILRIETGEQSPTKTKSPKR